MSHSNGNNEHVFTPAEIEQMKVELADIPKAAEILTKLQEHNGDILLLAQEYAEQHPEEIEVLNLSLDALNTKDKIGDKE